MLEELQGLKNDHGWRGGLLGILPTFFDDVTKNSRVGLAGLQENLIDLVLPPIHRATVLRDCSREGKTVFDLDQVNRSTKEYAALVWRVLDG